MTNKELNDELDKKKFFFVKYSMGINFLIFTMVVLMLYLVRIDNYSILELIINYYLNEK